MTGKLFKIAAVLAAFAATAGGAAAFPGADTHSSESRDAAQSLYEVIAAEIAAHREQPEVALALLDKTLERTKSSEVAELAWRTALQTRRPEIVLDQALAWAAIDPKAELAQRTILVNAVEKGLQPEYVEQLSRLYAGADDKAALVADVTTLLSQPELASSALESVLSAYWEKEAESAEVQLAVGLFRKARHDISGACRAGRAAIRLSPASEQVLTSAADLCWQADRAQTEAMLKNYLSKHPDAAAVRLIHARVLSRTGRIAEAMKDVDRAVKDSPDTALIALNAGQVATDCRAFQQAELYFTRYIDLVAEQNPEADFASSDIWLKLAGVMHENGRHQEEADALASLTDGELAPQARLREAAALAEVKRVEDARAVLQNAAEDYPEHFNLFKTGEAQMLIEAGMPEDALLVMTSACAKQPDDVSLAYDTAMIAQNVGRPETAESILKSILSADPDHIQAGNALAYLWVTRDTNLPEARRLLEHAYRLAPVDPYVLDSMGWLCFKEGRYDQAAEFTLASLKRLFDVEVACHLVEILAVSGRDREAEKLFRELEHRAGADARVLDLAQRLKYDSTGTTP